MCEERGKIDAPRCYQAHQAMHPLLASRTERGHDGVIAETRGEAFDWNPQMARIHSDAGKRSTGTKNLERVPEGILGAKRLYSHIHAASLCEVMNLADNVAACQ